MQRFVEVPGGRINAMSDGEGPPVALIHAGIADLRSWDAMVPGLMAAGFRAIRHDCRGYGATTTDDISFSFQDDLLAVLDAFGIERAALVGNSLGGTIAINAAIERPERVVAVVGVGAALDGYEPDGTPEEQALFDQLAQLMIDPSIDRDEVADMGLRIWIDGPGQLHRRASDAVHEAAGEMLRPLLDRNRVKGRPAAMVPPANDRLAELRCPVLAVAGALDVSSIVATAHRLEENAPNARAVILPDAAHMIGMEAPNRLNELIVDFLGPLRPWS